MTADNEHPGSTGNICTVRCRNNALAGPFGGCFPVQQAGAAEKTNVASKITTAQTKDGIDKQVAQNKEDLPAAIAANQQQGSTEGQAADQGVKEALNIQDPVIKESPVQTPALDAAEPAATGAGNNNNGNTGNAGGNANNNGGQTQTGNGRQRGGKNGGNANAATGNGNAATGATGGQGQGRQRGGNNNNKRFGRWVGRQLANLRQ